MSIYYALAGWSGNRERDERTKERGRKRKANPQRERDGRGRFNRVTLVLITAAPRRGLGDESLLVPTSSAVGTEACRLGDVARRSPSMLDRCVYHADYKSMKWSWLRGDTGSVAITEVKLPTPRTSWMGVWLSNNNFERLPASEVTLRR
ncbi:hypothetical protein EVAR_17226_1 [Eumeta japonica]|uniref:Uncharacterized protein n=1 Tax=Eumeta variegata TaxID=151549 RepID=A0A4C1U923_EUMVA|nr:hypothetical protein EVAR_17226_1 [Eumeta japonica]